MNTLNFCCGSLFFLNFFLSLSSAFPSPLVWPFSYVLPTAVLPYFSFFWSVCGLSAGGLFSSSWSTLECFVLKVTLFFSFLMFLCYSVVSPFFFLFVPAFPDGTFSALQLPADPSFRFIPILLSFFLLHFFFFISCTTFPVWPPSPFSPFLVFSPYFRGVFRMLTLIFPKSFFGLIFLSFPFYSPSRHSAGCFVTVFRPNFDCCPLFSLLRPSPSPCPLGHFFSAPRFPTIGDFIPLFPYIIPLLLSLLHYLPPILSSQSFFPSISVGYLFSSLELLSPPNIARGIPTFFLGF